MKGARLRESEGQAKLYFAPSVQNLPERAFGAAPLPREGDPCVFHRLAFKGKGRAVGPGHAQVANEIVTHTGNSTVMLGDQLGYNLPW